MELNKVDYTDAEERDEGYDARNWKTAYYVLKQLEEAKDADTLRELRR